MGSKKQSDTEREGTSQVDEVGEVPEPPHYTGGRGQSVPTEGGKKALEDMSPRR